MGILINEQFAKQILSDMDKIRETLCEILVTEKVEKKDSDTEVCSCGKIISKGTPRCEKKEQMKLWKQILDEAMPLIDNNLYVTCSKNAAKISIDAVIECFDEWINNCQQPRPFPEYLKEKLL